MDNVIVLQPKSPFIMEDGVYDIDIQSMKDKRTLQQNRYLWALIGDICKAEDGNIKDKKRVYINLLKMSGAKYEVITAKHVAVESLAKCGIFRDVQVVKQFMHKNDLFDTAYLFYGSSQMNKEEFAHLIDTALDYAGEIGLDREYWEAKFNEVND